MERLTQEKLVSTIRWATEEVFTTMLSVPAIIGEPYVAQASNQPFDGLIGLVGIAGTWVGAGRISCSATLACRLSGALLMSEYSAVNEDVLDAMAELTNMIIGNVKSTLEENVVEVGKASESPGVTSSGSHCSFGRAGESWGRYFSFSTKRCCRLSSTYSSQ